jgi:hypothetical protein
VLGLMFGETTCCRCRRRNLVAGMGIIAFLRDGGVFDDGCFGDEDEDDDDAWEERERED